MVKRLTFTAPGGQPPWVKKDTNSNLHVPKHEMSFYVQGFGAVREFANKSAASAASPDYVRFQAVIKSAASAASRKPKIKETKIQGSARTTGLGGTTGTAGRRGTVGRRNGAISRGVSGGG